MWNISRIKDLKHLNVLLRHSHTWFFTFLVILGLSWAITSLTWPLGWDQGIFAWVGDVINQGGLPYRDAWDIKGPLSYYIFAGAQLLFGHHMWAIRLFDLLMVLTASGVLAILISKLTNSIVARWASILFILWFASGNYWNTSQPDGWVSMIVIIGMAPLLISRGSLPWYKSLFAGVCIGCALLIKPLYSLFLFLVLIAILLQEWPRKKRILYNWIIVLAGLAIPLVVCAVWFINKGALNDLIEASIIYPMKIYAGINTISVESIIRRIITYTLSGVGISILIPIIGLGVLMLWRTSKKKAIIIVFWLLISLLIVITQNKYYTYHWVIIYPPVVILCAVGFYKIFFSTSASASDIKVQHFQPLQVLGALMLVVIIFYLTIHPLAEVSHWFSYISKRTSREQYYDSFGIPGSDIQAASYIKDRTKEADRIFVWGWNASIYFLSSRQASSRFGFSMPLLLGEGTKLNEAYRSELISDLTSDPPVYIVIAPIADDIVGKQYDFTDFSEFANIVSTKYTIEEVFGDLALYRASATSEKSLQSYSSNKYIQ
jgi:hypothetical protein